MATITIGERTIELPPYRTNLVAKAGPAIDRVMNLAARVSDDATPDAMLSQVGFTGLATLCSDLIEVIAAGAQKVDPTLTADAIGEHLGIGELPEMQKTFAAILAEAGLGSEAAATA